MYQWNGSLRQGGHPLVWGLAAALCAGVTAAVAGCPGPAPHDLPGGSGGSGSSSASSTSTSTSSSGASCPSAQRCVPPAPANWSGPLVVFEDPSAPPPTSLCPPDTGVALQGGRSANLPPATCTCSCMAPNVICGPPSASVWSGSVCSPTTAKPCVSGDVKPTCTLLGQGNNLCVASTTMTSVTVAVPVTMASQCMPNRVQTLPQPTWGVNMLACSPNGAPATCDNGVCAPDPGAQPASKICVSQLGDNPCPSGSYTNRVVIGTGFDDTRSCGDCSCGPPLAKCAGEIQLSGDQSCGGSSISVPVDCAPTHDPLTGQVFAEIHGSIMGTGSCAPDGGAADGGVTPSGVTTLCCL